LNHDKKEGERGRKEDWGRKRKKGLSVVFDHLFDESLNLFDEHLNNFMIYATTGSAFTSLI
jgi:hypothetical protein